MSKVTDPALLAQLEAPEAPEPTPPLPQTSSGEAFARGAAQGASLGFADEAQGGVAALSKSTQVPWNLVPGPRKLAALYPGVPYAEAASRWFEENRPDVAAAQAAEKGRQEAPAAYVEERNQVRAGNAKASKDRPLEYLGGQIFGGAATAPLTPAPGVARGAPLLSRIAAGAKAAAPVGALYGAGASEANSATGVAGDAALGAGGAAVIGGALPAVAEGVGRVAAPAAAWLRKVAGNRNIKAAGGIQSDITRARKQLGPGGVNDGRAELQEIGAEMGEKGLVGPLSTPAKTFDRAAELMDDAGTRMGDILAQADASGQPPPTLQGVVAGGRKILNDLQANPHTAANATTAHLLAGHSHGHSAADQFAGLLARYEKVYGNGPVSFKTLHQIRRNIDRDLYGMRGNKDPWADAYREALHNFRGVVSNEIDSGLDATIKASPAWQAANRDYQVGAKALEFADKGMDRAVGNNMLSPYELLAALTGAGIGSAHGGAGLTLGGVAAAGGMALARRHGSGTLGSAALHASNALRRMSGASAPQAAADTGTALTPAMVEWLRARYGISPVPAAAEDAP